MFLHAYTHVYIHVCMRKNALVYAIHIVRALHIQIVLLTGQQIVCIRVQLWLLKNQEHRLPLYVYVPWEFHTYASSGTTYLPKWYAA